MKTTFLKSFIIGHIILFFTIGGIYTVDFSSGGTEFISFVESASASGGGSGGGGGGSGSGGGSSYHSNSSVGLNSISSSNVVKIPSKPIDTTPPEILITYPEFKDAYSFEGENGNFEFIGFASDDTDPNASLEIHYNGKIFTEFTEFIAPVGESIMNIRARDESGNISEKSVKINFSKKSNKNEHDLDGDGLNNDLEKKIGTSPVESDSDFDGKSDYDEIKLFSNPLSSVGNLFADVGSGTSISESAIKFLLEKGSIRLNSQGLFYSGRGLNRAEAIKLLVSTVYDDLSQNYNVQFDDVSENDWYSRYLGKGLEMGIINGNKKNFDPYRGINRAEALKIIFKSLDFPISDIGPVNTKYVDISRFEWYSPYVAFAEVNGLGGGSRDGIFLPGERITRGEFAEILYNSAKISKSGKYKMYNEMPEGEWLNYLEKNNTKTVNKVLTNIVKKPNIVKSNTVKSNVIKPSIVVNNSIVKKTKTEKDLAAQKLAQEAARAKALADAKKAKEAAAAKAKAIAAAKAKALEAARIKAAADAAAAKAKAISTTSTPAVHTTTTTS